MEQQVKRRYISLKYDTLVNEQEISKLHTKFRKTQLKTEALTDRLLIMRVCRAIFKKVQEKLIHNEGGVVLDGFGYLAMQRSFESKVIRLWGSDDFCSNEHTNGYLYFPTLHTDVYRLSPLKAWTIHTDQFHDKILKGLAKELKKGKKYKFHYTFVRGLRLTYRGKKRRKRYNDIIRKYNRRNKKRF